MVWFDIKKAVKKKKLLATNDYKVFFDSCFNVHFVAIPTEKNGKPFFTIPFNVLNRLIKIIKIIKKISWSLLLRSTLTPLCSEKKNFTLF